MSSPTMDFCLRMVNNILVKEANLGFKNNVAISPLSISLMMNMVTASAKPHLVKELLTSMGSENVEEIHAESSKLMELASGKGSSNSGGPELIVANSVFLDQTRSVKPSFDEYAKKVYEAEIRPVDFANKPEEATEEVNSWVKKATKGLIPEVLRPGDPYIRLKLLLLINAIYFRGNWLRPFETLQTRENVFRLLNGEEVITSFMCESYQEYRYGEFDGFRLLKMPYRKGEDKRSFSMYFFLPGVELGDFVDQINNHPGFFNQDFNLRRKDIKEILIPRFKLYYQFTVNDVAEQMGWNHPCLDEMEVLDNDLPCGNAMVMTHRARVDVNEEGTEAAAVTSDDDLGCSFDSPPPLYFFLDRPFVFMIREDASRTPFFVGLVVNPLLEP